MSHPHDSIIVEKTGSVGRMTFNRPDQLNAINDEMGEKFHAALRDMENDERIRCLIVTGMGRAFSAGEDISGLRQRYQGDGGGDFEISKHPSLGDHLRKKYHPIILRMRNMQKPIIAQLNGIAAGSGASIALACDIRIASEDAGLKQAFVGVGLVPDSGSSYFLTRMVGPGRALELIMTGRTVSAREAQELGLINTVVPKDQLRKTVEETAQLLASGPTKALGMSKRIVSRVSVIELSEALEYEAIHQDVAGRTEDHLEAVKAFLEKRQPKFSGR